MGEPKSICSSPTLLGRPSRLPNRFAAGERSNYFSSGSNSIRGLRHFMGLRRMMKRLRFGLQSAFMSRVAIIKKKPQVKGNLLTMLQILGVSLFLKTPLFQTAFAN
jgi:hypothetical protein